MLQILRIFLENPKTSADVMNGGAIPLLSLRLHGVLLN
jgi:hypothetical protein